MKIAGLERCSFVDWPGMMTAVVFTPGCTMNCYYCHNHTLLGSAETVKTAPPEGVLGWLESRKGFLDGVVITGGEPLLQSGLPKFLDRLHDMGYAVKLDTNGTLPEELEQLLHAGRVDYVAMDIKAPRRLYNAVCGTEVDQELIDRSIACIMKHAPDYEFRTTVLPEFSQSDIVEMATRIQGAKRYILQQVRFPSPRSRRINDVRLAATPHTYIDIQNITRGLEGIVRNCETRGLQVNEVMAAVTG